MFYNDQTWINAWAEGAAARGPRALKGAPNNGNTFFITYQTAAEKHMQELASNVHGYYSDNISVIIEKHNIGHALYQREL